MKNESIEDVFNKIYDETYHKCVVYVTCKCKNTEDIPDILQDTYTELYKTLLKKGNDYIKNTQAYVLRIARSKVYDHYSLYDKFKDIIPLFGKNKEDEEYITIDINVDTFNNKLESNTIYKDSLNEIWSYIQIKSRGVQKAFYLFYYSDMKICDIAKELGENESTIKNRIYRTTNEIREKFGKDVDIT